MNTMPDTSPHGETVCSLIEHWDKEDGTENEDIGSPEYQGGKKHEAGLNKHTVQCSVAVRSVGPLQNDGPNVPTFQL